MNVLSPRPGLMALLGATFLLGGCTLLLGPGDHQGGTIDASGLDAGDIDAGDIDAGDIDAGDIDAGVPDAGPPSECSTSAECGGGGLVQCISGRCQFCASTVGTPHLVRQGAALRPRVHVAIRTQAAARTLGYVATLGETMGTPSVLHAFELAAIGGVTDFGLDDPTLSAGCAAGTPSELTSAALYADEDGVQVQILGRGRTGGILTYLRHSAFEPLVPAGYTCRDRANPADILTSGAMFFPPTEAFPVGVTRELSDTGAPILRVTDSAYANGTLTTNLASTFSTPEIEMVASSTHVLLASDPDIVLWDGTGVFATSRITAPGVSGPPSLLHLSGDAYLLAFPVGGTMRFSELSCPSTSDCTAVGASADLPTGAETIEHSRMMAASGQPILLTAERLASGSRRVVLRVIRPNRRPFDGPIAGTTLVLDDVEAGFAVHDVELDVLDGSIAQYLVVWHREVAGGDSAVYSQVITGTCGS